MTAASRSLATALWRARFASGLLRPSYTTSWDTTFAANKKNPAVLSEAGILGALLSQESLVAGPAT